MARLKDYQTPPSRAPSPYNTGLFHTSIRQNSNETLSSLRVNQQRSFHLGLAGYTGRWKVLTKMGGGAVCFSTPSPPNLCFIVGACQLHAAAKHALLNKAKVTGHQHRWQVTPTEGSSKDSDTPCSSRKAALFYHLCILPPEVSPCLLTPSLSSRRTDAPKKSSFPACPAAVTGQACSPLASAGSRGSQELCLGLVSTSLTPGAHLTWGLWLRKWHVKNREATALSK